MDEIEEFLRLNGLQEEIIKLYKTGERNFIGTDLEKILIDCMAMFSFKTPFGLMENLLLGPPG